MGDVDLNEPGLRTVADQLVAARQALLERDAFYREAEEAFEQARRLREKAEAFLIEVEKKFDRKYHPGVGK